MKSAYNLLRLSICALLLCGSLAASATHYLSGTITYRHIQANQYAVQVVLYTDYVTSSGQPSADEPETVLHCLPNLEAGCADALQNEVTVRIPRQRFELISAQCGALTVRKNFYTALITLPPNRWTLLVDNVNRRGGIVNISNSVATTGTIATTLDNSTGLVNNSAEFISTEIPSLNGNQYHRLTARAIDVDGDSVAYEFVTPQQGLSARSCPRPADGFFQPPHFRLDAVTGVLETVPFTLVQGHYVTTIQANEFRRLNGGWTKIGSVQHDFMYLVRSVSTANSNPRFSALQRGNATLDFARPIPVNPGQTVELTLTATDPDAGQQLTFSSLTPMLYSALYPSASFPTIQKLSATQARLTWQIPASLPVGRYQFGLAVTDDFCQQYGQEIRPITFVVTNQVIAGTKRAADRAMEAYPTPFHEQVRFQLSQPGSRSLTVVDGLGRAVAQLTSRPDGSVLWQPGPALTPGLYLARTADGQEQVRLLRE